MAALTRTDIKKIEEYWINHEQNKKQLKYREWELLYPYQEEERIGGISSGNISNTTQQKAMALMQDAFYQNLKKIVEAIEGLYTTLDSDSKTIVDMRYWCRNDFFEWEDIADKLYMSRHKVLRKRNMLLDKTAKAIGWV